MILRILNHPFGYEMECLTRLFYPGEKIALEHDGPDLPETLSTEVRRERDGVLLRARVWLGGYDRELSERHPTLPEAEQERLLAVLLFELLCEQTGTRPPWGILTGVRPVRRCHGMLSQGSPPEKVIEDFKRLWLATPAKAALAVETALTQLPMLRPHNPREFSLYVGIPFCPSRCLYCSFVSHDIEKALKLAPLYVELLCAEIRETAAIAREHRLVLKSVYFGGGTPTSLPAEQLERLLGEIARQFDISEINEYTVEAGRPDTITQEKLETLRRFSVNRISINPQTFSDGVLQSIGRGHTVAQFYSSFALARAAGFGVINTDIIAGLPGETRESFTEGLNALLRLRPENITLHTLTVKRSSRLRQSPGAFSAEGGISAWLDAAAALFGQAGYRPYYLYRQKGTRENLENVGYSLPGCKSGYNVAMMEEIQTVLAVGAGGVSKLYAPPARLERIFNYKYPYEYTQRFEEITSRKSGIRRFYERG